MVARGEVSPVGSVCATQGRLISEPDRPLADHAAFGNQCVVKKKIKKMERSICRSPPGHDINTVGKMVCVSTTTQKKKDI